MSSIPHVHRPRTFSCGRSAPCGPLTSVKSLVATTSCTVSSPSAQPATSRGCPHSLRASLLPRHRSSQRRADQRPLYRHCDRLAPRRPLQPSGYPAHLRPRARRGDRCVGLRGSRWGAVRALEGRWQLNRKADPNQDPARRCGWVHAARPADDAHHERPRGWRSGRGAVYGLLGWL